MKAPDAAAGLTVPGSFSKVEGGVSDLGFSAEGTVSVDPDGTWRLSCRQAPKALRVILGIVGVFIAVLATVALAMLLEELGLDLMGARKGPALIGMGALALSIGAWSLAAMVSNALFGSEKSEQVAASVPIQVTRHAADENALNILWPNSADSWRGTAFKPKDLNQHPVLLNIPRG